MEHGKFHLSNRQENNRAMLVLTVLTVNLPITKLFQYFYDIQVSKTQMRYFQKEKAKTTFT